jgi:hypothetical protein
MESVGEVTKVVMERWKLSSWTATRNPTKREIIAVTTRPE